MKKLYYLLILIALVLFMYPSARVVAAVDLPWSTTFNCPEWTLSDGGFACDGLNGGGGWTSRNGAEEQITLAANNPGGGGGRGLRHWEGDGKNNNSGGLNLNFNTPQPELWIRWYMRYEKGFKWSVLRYDKIIYMYGQSSTSNVIEWYGGGQRFSISGVGNNVLGTFTWDTIMQAGGGATYLWSNGETHYSSDGLFHSYEVHLKKDTNGSNGVAEVWIDGVLLGSRSDLNLGGPGGWQRLLIGSNQAYPLNGRDMALDYDDIAVSTTGYIGPIGGGGGPDITPPFRSGASPTGALPSGTTSATLSLTTNENADCNYDTVSGTAYASMPNTFTTTGGTTHSASVAGLSDGNTYNYYVRCQDTAGNVNTSDYVITFSVASPAGNTPPVANAGPDQNVTTGSLITLDGSLSSDADGDPFSYIWSFATIPTGSAAVLNNPATVSPSFTPDVAGVYTVNLVVNDGTVDSVVDIVTITAASGGAQQSIIFYPSPGDGSVSSVGSTWSIAHDAVIGNGANYTSVDARVSVGESSNFMGRAFFSFDTSGIPDNAVITNAELNLYIYQRDNNDNDGDDWINVVQGTQSNTTSLIADDFDQAGAINNPTEGAARIDITGIPTNQYTTWTLNAAGMSWINKQGHTQLAIREGHDAINSAPTAYNRIKFYASEQAGTSQDPYLNITYTTSTDTTAPQAPTGLQVQ